MRRFAARWMRATDATLPQLDIEKGAERLLRTQRVSEFRRPARLRLWMAAAALTAIATIIVSLRLMRPYDLAVARRPADAKIRLSENAVEQVHPLDLGPNYATETWQELERAGQFDRAVEEAERVGLDTIYDSVNAAELMSLARAARFAGREDVSKGALLTCRRRFPASRDAAMAAYLLGRNAPPAEAVKSFSIYLAEQPDGIWAREASGRLIEAYRASGDMPRARDAAEQYLARYPAGPHADFAKMVLDN